MWRFLLLPTFFLWLISCREHTDIPYVAEAIVPEQLYVIYSLSDNGESQNTSSNIYVIKGLGDTVWLFGAGYGDGDTGCDGCNDYTYYKGEDFHVTHSALDDARKADSVITKVLGMERAKTSLFFIAPHFHADHINAEFLSAFFDSLHYSQPDAQNLLVHANDLEGATCNEPCCGAEPCPDKSNPFYASPYQPAWSVQQLEKFRGIGSAADTCNTITFKFSSPSGDWQVMKALDPSDGGHTRGTVNLLNHSLRIRINGTINRPQCPLPANWNELPIHGRVEKTD